MKKKTFVVGMLIGGLAGLAGAAQAASGGRFPAATCVVASEDRPFADVHGGGWQYTSTSGDLDLSCPFVDGNSWDKSQIDELIVQGFDPDQYTHMWAQPCVDYTTGGGACGTQFTNGPASTTGASTISVYPGNTWSSNSAHYGYLGVRLPPKIGTTMSRLYGYKLVDNP